MAAFSAGQAEGIPAHGMQDVEAAHALDASDDVANGVIAHVPHVESATGVREHFEDVILGFLWNRFRLEDVILFPTLLPLRFDRLRVVVRHE